MEELEDALEGCKRTSSGPDLICYEMVKEMGYTDKEHLLESYNKIWSDGTYPVCCCLSLFVVFARGV
jgi:hypothetical protein